MSKALITPPAALPVTLADVKAHLRVETDDEDDYLSDLIATATAQVEAETGRALIGQTWRVYRDDWPADGLVELPVSPVRAIAEIRVYGVDGAPATLAGDAYLLDAVSDPPRLLLAAPPLPGAALNGIEIDVEAGFGDTGADVPDTLVRAILVLAAHWHEHRGAEALGGVPQGFARLIAPFARPRL